MTEGLRHTLLEHALGNPRVLCNMAEDLLLGSVSKHVLAEGSTDVLVSTAHAA